MNRRPQKLPPHWEPIAAQLTKEGARPAALRVLAQWGERYHELRRAAAGAEGGKVRSANMTEEERSAAARRAAKARWKAKKEGPKSSQS